MSGRPARAGRRGGKRSAGPSASVEAPSASAPAPPRDPAERSGRTEDGRHPILAIASTALALGFYLWALAGHEPMSNKEMRVSGFEPLAGLATALGGGVAAAAVLGIVLSAFAPLRSRRAAVALAAAWFYLSAGAPALGRAAIVIAPLAVVAHLVWLELRKPRAMTGSFLLALHAGAFVSALGFFHDWRRYAAGWKGFVSNVSALVKLLL
jgi:hypothetical protein